MDYPDKLATQGTQDEENQNEHTTQYIFDTAIRKQTQIQEIRHPPPTNNCRQRRTEHRFY